MGGETSLCAQIDLLKPGRRILTTLHGQFGELTHLWQL